MPYSPSHPNIYAAAFSGALAGLGMFSRGPQSISPSSYEDICNIADTFAQVMDTNYSGSEGQQDVTVIGQLATAYFANRGATSLDGSSYVTIVNVMLAILTKADTFLPALATPGASTGIPVYWVKACSLSNNSINYFDVTNLDGLTAFEGDIVLLVCQNNPVENGPYVVGIVSGGIAPLTRPSWWAAGSNQYASSMFYISSGNVYGATVWQGYRPSDKYIVVDGQEPDLYPTIVVSTGVTLSGGVAEFRADVRSTGASAFFNRVNGVNCNNTVIYKAVLLSGHYNSGGKVQILANLADGTQNLSDTSIGVITLINK